MKLKICKVTLWRKVLVVLPFVCLMFTPALYAQSDLSECRSLLEQKKFSAALVKIDTYLSSHPGADSALVLKGRCYLGMGKAQESYESFSAAIKKNGKSADAYYWRAFLFFNSGNVNEAKNDLGMALKSSRIDSLTRSILLLRSSANLETMNYSGVIEDCQKVLEKDTVNMDALNNMALAYSESGQPDSALPILYKIVSLDSNKFYAVMNIGYVLLSKERYEEAISWLDKAVRIDSKEAFSYSNRAYAKLKLGRLNEAMSDINKSISLDKTNSYAFRNRALIFLEMDKKDKACDDIASAITLGFREKYGKEVDDLKSKYCK